MRFSKSNPLLQRLVVACIFLPLWLPARTVFPGNHEAVGRLSVDSRGFVLLENAGGRNAFLLADDYSIALDEFLGKWVRMQYTQINQTSMGAAKIRDVRVEVMYDESKPYPLTPSIASEANLNFGEPVSFIMRLQNSGDHDLTFRDFAYAYLARLPKRPISLSEPPYRPGASQAPRFGQSSIRAGETLAKRVTCSNLIPPGRYQLRYRSPVHDDISITSPAIDLVVQPVSRQQTLQVLRRVAATDENFQHLGRVAWILWREYDSQVGLDHLEARLERERAPMAAYCGLLVAAKGEAAHNAFVRAARKARPGYVHHWCEQARKSPEAITLFDALLREQSEVSHQKNRGRLTPINQIVAEFLIPKWDEAKAFNWREPAAQRNKVIQQLRTALRLWPHEIPYIFSKAYDFNAEQMDHQMERALYTGLAAESND
jgi:hypothetical protein